MRFDSAISHVNAMKGIRKISPYDDIDAGHDTGLPSGRYASAANTDETVRAAAYCYGSFASVPDYGDGHWTMPLLPNNPDMAPLTEIFSMGLVGILYGRAFIAGPSLKKDNYSQWAKNGFLPASATVIGCVISTRTNEFVKA